VSTSSIDVAERALGEAPRLDDPAETFHEASKLAPSTIGAQLAGGERLALDPQLRETTRRASRTHPHRPAVRLPRPLKPPSRLTDVVDRRRSRLPEQRQPLALRDLATILHVAYGARATPAGSRRPVPSAGALYPLELYVLAQDVRGLADGIYHYDPYAHGLESLGPLERERFAGAWYEPDVADRAAAAIVLTAVFARTRCKYDLRGYRFALLEAGHVAQNLLLAATAVGGAALPYGGAYDRRLDALLGVDGLHESTLHVVLVG
jgi:SagB-type dehydrogenase family enzyme